MLKNIEICNETILEKLRKKDQWPVPGDLVKGKNCNKLRLTGLSNSGG